MIKIKNLTKNFNRRAIFKNFSLDIPSNELVFVVGPSGIGKTTLINLIANFSQKDKGEILFYKDNKIVKNPLIDVVFQDFNLIESATGMENIKIGANAINFNIDEKNIQENASFVNISKENLANKVSDLSGGQKQRIAILRSLARESDFILLDEPTGNLDVENAEILFEKIQILKKNKTILIVSHNLDLAKKYGDRIIYLKNESVLEIDKIEEINKGESLNKTDYNFKFEKKPLKISDKLKSIILFLKLDFKNKIIITALLIITFLISILSLNLFATLDTQANAVDSQRIHQYNLDSFELQKKGIAPFFDGEIEKFNTKKDIVNKIIPIYSTQNFAFTYNNNGKELISEKNDIELIDESDFFKNRFKFDDKNLQGNFIQNENEIIISNSVVTKLKITDPVGKKIKIKAIRNSNVDEIPTIFEATIVGVNYSTDVSNTIPSFLHYNLAKKIEEAFYVKNTVGESLFSDIMIAPLNAKGFEELEVEKNHFLKDLKLENLKISNGELPKNKDEIAVSVNTIDEINNIIDNLNNGSTDKYEKLKIGSKVQLSNKRGQDIPFKIVGTFDLKENHHLQEQKSEVDAPEEQRPKLSRQIIMHNDGDEYRNEIRPRGAKIFLKSENISENLDSFKKDFPNFSYSNDLDSIKTLLLRSTFFVQATLLVIQVILIVLLVVFSVLYAKNLTQSKLKSIGILKSLGEKTKKIFLLHILNIFVISFLILISGLIISLPSMPYFYNLITTADFISPTYTQIFINFIVIWFSISLLIFLIYFFISLKYYKKPVTELLKNSL
ncbi:ATP-binding cassette domain-containing protein [Mesomycoplasma ovipneumoniae]|uniref:ATP-binding cassette domain-containing protein n=1 Tax=Mesomycoplasma ovipneumoniae TaxID=29562 RepID=A0AAP5Y3R3_9BACT|nr:ATP-binding cassette domain-containing protein [Mesomycoplasma ovipneumoniae]MDW2907354.1 ATP-binding cassette domain-containing protein [Mesomycoplasma ovipneumoniae]MDW2911421.1 ATP-binding cassette domain-containing protein [Mesomycoplasma ovipneumoniae]MDW2912321.1 ATP-binding cassette domain-containing protein [Mesomycoplasma ovipneumoniae]MDW2913256.1 ATP-binding cassette domain-containing protein [Mesomycoplasma ovipneumoniae]MDW2915598.1 ATP-binding cassette domain-containing protei